MSPRGEEAGSFSDEEDDSSSRKRGDMRYSKKNDFNHDEEEERRLELIVPYLARRAFHLPGKGWCYDWFQYVIANNHPFFSLCFAHKDHPVTKLERVLVFLSSIAASLVISNGLYIFFIIRGNGNLTYMDFLDEGDDAEVQDEDTTSYSDYEITLLTLGALLLTAFDMGIWIVAACSCCEAGGRVAHLNHLSWSGTVVLAIILVGTSVFAMLLLFLIATIDSGTTGEDVAADTNYTLAILDLGFAGISFNAAAGSFGSEEFQKKWTTWILHLCLSLFVYDLIFSTTLFSGIFGCLSWIPLAGPIFGGRPLEIEEDEKERKAARRRERKLQKGDRRAT
jgi:hypothetical protein